MATGLNHDGANAETTLAAGMIPVALFMSGLPIDPEAPRKRIGTAGQVDRFIAATAGKWLLGEFFALALPIDSLQSASLPTTH